MAFFDHDFLDELTDKLASTGNVISEKAKELTESAKVSLQIAQEEKKLRAAYRQLGMYVYEKSGIEADEEMASYFAAITEAKLNITNLKCAEDTEEAEDVEMDESDVETVEPELDDDVEESAEEAEQELVERVCPVCRNVVSAQLIYCPKCGGKLK